MSAPTLSATFGGRAMRAVAGAVLCLALIAGAGLALAAASPAQRTSGDQLWAQLFAPPGMPDCRGVAAAAAPDGSLYVAASSAAADGSPARHPPAEVRPGRLSGMAADDRRSR